jgi:hypothetical protein
MERTMKALVRIATLIACLASGNAVAGDFDGSKVLICAPAEAMDCASGAACTNARPVDLGAPAFFRVDVGNRSVIGPKRTTQIQFIEKGEDQLLLQGTELGLAWTFALNSADGTMAVTFVDRQSVAVLFGSCTPL